MRSGQLTSSAENELRAPRTSRTVGRESLGIGMSEWVNAYVSLLVLDERVRGEFRDARLVERLREDKALSMTFFMPSQPWVTTTPVVLSKTSIGVVGDCLQ